MSRKYLLDCTASGAKWADDVQFFNLVTGNIFVDEKQNHNNCKQGH